jgi:hypothetical protein
MNAEQQGAKEKTRKMMRNRPVPADPEFQTPIKAPIGRD